ncbi:hypothetical protein CYY_003616 [Polysphondylium violaceum]|uniref:Transmembrane protein n=1 Tax=Polysphondylium violaceum TaxID=133409 RepID=A0A8J4PWR6_9MYCE|nr:hypothetical protein CYY_003616 [Polysphondylium violaceum]
MRQEPLASYLRTQGKIYWPFLIGVGVWGALISKMYAGITEEDKKNSYYWKKIEAKLHPQSHGGSHGHH